MLFSTNVQALGAPPKKIEAEVEKKRTEKKKSEHCGEIAVYSVWKQYVVFEQVRMCVYYCAHIPLFIPSV